LALLFFLLLFREIIINAMFGCFGGEGEEKELTVQESP